MSLGKLITSVLLGAAYAAPNSRRDIDNTQPVGENKIRGFSVQYLGIQRSDSSCNHRDLGFAGHIQGKWYGVYGDNLWCAPGVTDTSKDPQGFHGMVRDSVAALGNDPLVVHDLNLNNDSPVAHPQQFVPWISWWGETQQTGFGGTSIVETDWDSATGALYYLINQNEDYAHAGIGKVQIQNGSPRMIQRLGDQGWVWDTNKTAKWGDISAYRDERSEYIYIFGHPPQGRQWPDSEYVYQARVKAHDAFDLSKYEYWWGRQQGWKSQLLDTFNAETAVMWGVGQGSMVYSNLYNCYIYVHLSGSTVTMRTAPSPEGPWSADKEIYKATPINGALVYAAVVYPYLDISSKTLTVGFTNDNNIQVIKVNFN